MPTHLPKESSRRQARQARKELAAQVIVAMQNGLHNPDFALTQVADDLHVSTRHIQRYLKEQGIDNFRSQLAKMRIVRAAQLLQHRPTLKIADLAKSCGYRQQHQFAKAFNAYWGMNPKDWRKRCQNIKKQDA